MSGREIEIAGSLVGERQRSSRVHASTWKDPGSGSPRWPVAAHEGVEIAWCVTGCAIYEVGSQTLELTPGHIVVLPEGVEHRTRLAPHTHAMSLKADPALVTEALDGLDIDRVETTIIPHSDILAKVGSLLVNPHTRERSPVSVDGLAGNFIRRMFEPRAARPAMRRDPRIRRAMRCIEERLAEPLEIEDLARAAGMSRYHFSRSFRAETGTSPYQWLIAKRVERAAELFHRRRLTVTEAAFEVGFSDLSRFARAFRDQFGCPPSSFAAA